MQVLWLRVWGLGFGVWGLGFWLDKKPRAHKGTRREQDVTIVQWGKAMNSYNIISVVCI